MVKLIDREELLAVIEEHCYTLCDRFNSTDKGMFLCGIKQAINEQPTVDTERNAHWIVVGGDLGYVDCKCSACGYTGCSDSALFDESELYNYCPDCGCKMDEDRNESRNT